MIVDNGISCIYMESSRAIASSLINELSIFNFDCLYLLRIYFVSLLCLHRHIYRSRHQKLSSQLWINIYLSRGKGKVGIDMYSFENYSTHILNEFRMIVKYDWTFILNSNSPVIFMPACFYGVMQTDILLTVCSRIYSKLNDRVTKIKNDNTYYFCVVFY